MNEVSASMHECIDPNGGDKPEFGKIDAKQKPSALMRERSECVSALEMGEACFPAF